MVPRGSTVRPTSDRVREAWMSILGARLTQAKVLDLYAGSGALGLEALSRGAATVEFVERNSKAVVALERNIVQLGLEDVTSIRRQDALRFAERLSKDAYDIVFADPPYADGAVESLIALFRAVPFGRILSLEHPAAAGTLGDDTRFYGSTAISFCHAP